MNWLLKFTFRAMSLFPQTLGKRPSATNRIIPLNAGFAGDWFGVFDVVLSGDGHL